MNTPLFSIEAFSRIMPKIIIENYSVKSFISINRHNAIFAVEEKATGQISILKILDKEYFNKSLYQKIFALTDSYLLLPKHFISDSVSICSLYPQMLPLPEVLYTKGINYFMIHNLISDIGKAVSTLHSHHILHLDITPDNIFMDKDEHFYLGDFSSSQFSKKTSLLSFCHYCRTGSTPAFAPNFEENTDISYWNDCYSLSLLLYMLCNYGNLPGNKEKNFSPFDSLLSFLEKTLQKPDSIHQNLINNWIKETENLFIIYGKDSACKEYYFQIDNSTLDFLPTSTLENVPANNSRVHITKIIHPFTKFTFSVPVPLYGILVLCGFILLFSIYHYASNINNKDIPSLSSYNFAFENNFSPPMASPTTATKPPAASPLPPKDILKSEKTTPAPASKKDFILNLSKVNCQNHSFQVKLSRKPFVKILFANHCNITDTATFADLENLEELYLFDNNIIIPKGFRTPSKLKILVLSKNKITDLSPLSKLTSLTTLDLSHNHHLRHIASLTAITNLRTLILTNTNITQKEITYLQRKLPNCIIFY